MKRDMDLVRQIAFATEALQLNGVLSEMPGIEADVFFEHVRWMSEAGLLHAEITVLLGTERATARRLTWAGCEFVDAARSDTLWRKAKEQMIRPGMSFTFDLLKDWLKAEIAQGLLTVRGLAQQ